jgi:hypothetical protein
MSRRISARTKRNVAVKRRNTKRKVVKRRNTMRKVVKRRNYRKYLGGGDLIGPGGAGGVVRLELPEGLKRFFGRLKRKVIGDEDELDALADLYIELENELEQTKEKLNQTEVELELTKTELTKTKAELQTILHLPN